MSKESLENLNNISHHKRTTSKNSEDYLKIEDINIDERISEIDDNFDLLKKLIPYNPNKLLKEIVNETNEEPNKTDRDEGEKKDSIGPISTLEYMVEKAFGFDSSKLNQITSKIIELKPLIFRWRRVMGDGNCFYRAVIFSYLEQMIFEKNIYFLQLMCIEVQKIFNPNNPMLKNLPSELRKKYSKVDQIFFDIMFLICEIIEKFNEIKHIKKAYDVLYQSIIKYKEFDHILIKYLRYKIFEYVSQNENKIYSEEFKFRIRDLLPEKYITNDTYNFNEYYHKELLELYKEAESITIHLIPFVLKVDVTILPYDFENTQKNQNNFSCFLENKNKIILLLKKNHYDLIYSKNYFEKYSHYLTNYNIKERKKSILSTEVLLSMENIERLTKSNYPPMLNTLIKQTSDPNNSTLVETPKKLNNPEISQISERHLTDNGKSSTSKQKPKMKKKENKECNLEQINATRDIILTNLRRKNVNFEIFKSAYNHDFKKIKLTPLKEVVEQSLLKCSKCSKTKNCFNFIKQCKECLDDLLRVNILRRFKYFFTFSMDVMLNNLDRNFPEILKKRFFKEIPIHCDNNYIELRLLPAMLSKDAINYYYEFKKELCIICFQKITSKDLFFKLPCGCLLCSKNCIIKHLVSLFDPYHSNLSKDIVCFCLYKFKVRSIQEMISSLINYNIEDSLLDYFFWISTEFEINLFKENCFSCMKKLVKDEYKEKTIKGQAYKHNMCKNCITKYSLVEYCYICDIEHTL